MGPGTGGFGRVRRAGRPRALVGTALLLTVSATIVGLRAWHGVAGRGGTPNTAGTAAVRGAAGAPRVTITPPDGATGTRPDLGVVVKVANGMFNEVVVRSKGTSLPGVLSPDRTSWRTRWTLVPGRSYAVRATATSPQGRTTTATSSCTTRPATQTITISDITPQPRGDRRRRHADHRQLRPAGPQQRPGRARPTGALHQTGPGRLALGRRPAGQLPHPQVLAPAPAGHPDRAPGRCAGRQGRLRHQRRHPA